ncbi:cache domain-containing sensor histidine kinase [Paenibacillus contaminans]|uniref:histidine kinase n=1 Tax=Paenibacillus contaminans TaxID=450362 RepID=A0A329LZA4_9BACL|nr:sensor histidine kinase [Paenibacillus contaminans]RAV11763.1 sensor histidine kinase [Paenibacillus contaminans]
MKRWFDKSLQRKLSLLLLVAVVFPLLATGVVSYRIASSLTEEKAKQSGMNTLRQIADKLEFMISDVENMSVFIIGQRDIQQYLDNERADISLFTLNIGFLTNLVFSKPYISNITVLSAYDYPPLSSTTLLRSGLQSQLEAGKSKLDAGMKWWTSLYENQTSADGLKRVVSLVRPVRSTNQFRNLGVLSISLDENEMRRILKNAGWEQSGFVLLTDPDGVILSGDSSEWLSRPLQERMPNLAALNELEGTFTYSSEGRGEDTVLYRTIAGTNWKLIGVIPTRTYTAQNQYVLTVTAVAIGVALLVSVVFVLLFLRRVTRPLRGLATTLKDINPDEAIPSFAVKSADEVGLLLHSFNKLSERIQRLMEQVQQNEAKKKEADIMALQAQINPHFLYNTLSSIHWIALMNKDGQIAEMVGALSDFLRFSLNKGEEFCKASQEVAHAQNYVKIMAIRFQDKFEAKFYIDPKLQDEMMLKLLLQPLIENSIMHGLQKKKGRGHLYVHGELQGESMTFVVEDTGIGMDESRLNEIRGNLNAASGTSSPEPGRSGYGLRNVHQRLQLHYGTGTGLQIESEAGAGTRISFTIPIMEERRI